MSDVGPKKTIQVAGLKRSRPRPKEDLKLRVLLERGLPRMDVRAGQTQSSHTSGHLPIDREVTDQHLNVMQDWIDYIREDDDGLDGESRCLEYIYQHNIIYYTSEADVQRLVGDILYDILRLSQFAGEIVLHLETYDPFARCLGRGGNKSYFWLIYRGPYQPMLVVEVNLLIFPMFFFMIVSLGKSGIIC